jgi:hypothetical protein
MMAAGAEAETSSILSQAEDEAWIKVDLQVPSAPLSIYFLLMIQYLVGSSCASAPEQCS